MDFKFLLNKNEIANSNKNAALSTWNTITNVVNNQTGNTPTVQANTNTIVADQSTQPNTNNAPTVQALQAKEIDISQAPITPVKQDNTVITTNTAVSAQTLTESKSMDEQLNSSNKPTHTGSLFNFDLSLGGLSEEEENKLKSSNV